jgi:hypothetical protein
MAFASLAICWRVTLLSIEKILAQADLFVQRENCPIQDDPGNVKRRCVPRPDAITCAERRNAEQKLMPIRCPHGCGVSTTWRSRPSSPGLVRQK